MKTPLLCSTLLAALVCVSGGAQASLVGRDINGNAVAGNAASSVFLYDTVLNVTWLRNANANGLMNWTQANTWAANLVVGAYDDWRLPTLGPVNGTSFNYNFTNNGTSDHGFGATGAGWGTASEMGHLFYVTLGNKGYCTPGAGGSSGCAEQPGWGLTNTGAFQNLQSVLYWSGLEYAPNTYGAWYFNTYDGSQYDYDKTRSLYALAVRPGDVLAPAAVPIPAALPLLLSGLAALGVAGRRRGRGRLGA
jgi:hypothetical protein